MESLQSINDECVAVGSRYSRRCGDRLRYSLLNPAVLLAVRERQRPTAALLVNLGYVDLSGVRLLEVGCGTGRNLLEFLRLGFAPEHLLGIELLKPSADEARRVLPESVRIIVGDAAGTAGSQIPATSYDVVFQGRDCIQC